MADDEFLCVRCARHQVTCCQDSEIYVTPGDVERIGAFTGRGDFFEFLAPVDPIYLQQDDDPTWTRHVIRADGTRRVLKRHAAGDCTFLGKQGCTLQLEVRPLVCRIYPFDYTADGIKVDLARGCPLELLKPGQGLVEALDMKRVDAERWHRQLYDEVVQDAF